MIFHLTKTGNLPSKDSGNTYNDGALSQRGTFGNATDARKPAPRVSRWVLPLLLTLFLLQGCGLSVTNSLQLVIAAAEAAVGIISPEYATRIDPYLKAVSQATSFAATELASTDTSPVKAEKIISQFAAIAGPNLPAGVPQTIVTAIQAVVTAVSNFLASIQPAAPPHMAATAARASGRTVKPQTVPKEIKLSPADERALVSIKTRADALAAKIGK